MCDCQLPFHKGGLVTICNFLHWDVLLGYALHLFHLLLNAVGGCQSSLESSPPSHCARGTVTGSFIVAIFRFLHPTLTSLASRKDKVLTCGLFLLYSNDRALEKDSWSLGHILLHTRQILKFNTHVYLAGRVLTPRKPHNFFSIYYLASTKQQRHPFIIREGRPATRQRGTRQ